MGAKSTLKKPKIILVPFPAQGHVTPMLNLGLAFVSHGFEPIIVTPEFIHHRLVANMDPNHEVRFMSIPDGLDEEGPHDFFAIEKAMENIMPMHLESLIRKIDEEEKEEEENGRVVCMVIDLLASWAIEVANRCPIPVAGFWPAMEATYRLITAIPDMVHSDLISETGCPQRQGTVVSLPSQPLLSTEDLPWLIGTQASRKARFKFWIRTLERSRTLRWLLVNSFSQEFIDDDDDPDENPIVFPVAPLSRPSLMVKNPSFWEVDISCLDWLDKQKPNSVLYISFGSWVSPIGDSKMNSLALTLEALRRPFIWVLADVWRQGLPNGYLERVSKQGKVVSWAPQLQVLQHKAVGFYLTHCGWNSTMEAIQCQKRLLCYPVAGDQFINCKYIVEVWKIGVKIFGLGQKDVEEALEKVTEDDEMKERLMRLYQRTMGEEAGSRVVANLKAFLLDSTKDFKHFNL
ncbi:UDP-glycosyltransferase 82A1-like [Durio zibethinus]|uniref:UDP-glycosyltransferase 82A1-like n=1 Tax=Durio zibethinus TaxID=66656 RepID=A0A6P6A541_DURZI|nr:UDP-glycosyltransferase 82A1-like [Durio zibethinus]